MVMVFPIVLAALPVALAAMLAFALGERQAGRAARIAQGAALLSLLCAIAAAPSIDAVAAVMLVLVSFIGFIVVRYAETYLRAEPGQARFTGWLCATLASVILLVSATTLPMLVLAWIASSLFLHRLLLFYPDRAGARRAARKKFLTARMGDAALIGAAACLWFAYGSVDIATILAGARDGAGGGWAMAAAGSLALAAVLKSAQFPTHGWLIDVIETPTPVSALLHAGVINAGGFLLIRFADVMLLAPGVLALLVAVGGLTAIVGGLVMLTQPAVKTSLAWSTVAQMGFMILQCGLALFPLALLHIVAHSLYKAHAFLSAGGAVERIAAAARPGPVAVPGPRAVAGAFALALGIYALVGLAFGSWHKSPQAIALGAILIFGTAYLIAQGLADAAPRALTRATALYATAAAVGYFALQGFASWLMADVLPPTPAPQPLEWALILLAVTSFGAVAVAQAMFPLWAYHPAATGLRVHLSNGLYANALFDRLVGGWSHPRSTQSQEARR